MEGEGTMCDKNVTTSNNERLYLATFEFISGEYGQPFKKIFYARDAEHLETEIDKYFVDYYGSGNLSEINRRTYFYFDGEVAVRKHGWDEITDLKQLVNKLL